VLSHLALTRIVDHVDWEVPTGVAILRESAYHRSHKADDDFSASK